MPFAVTIDKPEDIAGLSLEQVSKAIGERSEVLHQIFEEAGPTLDPTKVKSITVQNGGDLAAQIKSRNDELAKLGERRDALRDVEDARKNAEHELRWSKEHSKDPKDFAPDGKKDAGRRQIKSLGDMVMGAKSRQGVTLAEWAKGGAKGGIDFSFPDMLPSDAMAKAALPLTMGSKTLFETGAGWDPDSLRMPGFVDAVTRPIQLLDIIPLAETNSDTIRYMEETTRTHNAAEKAEGSAYAESVFALTERTKPVEKVTDSLPVTDEQLEDVPQAAGYINGRLLFGVRQRLDGQCLVGSGTPPALMGIKNTSGIQSQAKGADTLFDAMYKAADKVRVTGRATPTHYVMHSTDWAQVALEKTSDGYYLLGNPSSAVIQRAWGLPVVLCEADSAGTGYVGSFMPMWITLFERRGVNVEVGYVGDQFKEGKRTVRADGRWSLVLFRPAAFCQLTGI